MFLRHFVLLLAAQVMRGQINVVLESWQADKHLKGASYGFYVQDTKTGETLAKYNEHELMIPASTLKIITSSAALKLLGTDFRYKTKLAYTGNFKKESGVLEGNLIIFGSGDPSLQSEYFGKETVTGIWALAVKEHGIKQVTGKIVGDASAFERAIPAEWVWGDISNYFGASSCGLSFMDNKFKLLFNSGPAGTEAKLAGTSPNYLKNVYSIYSDVMARGSDDGTYVYGDPYSFQKQIRGNIPPHKNGYEVEVALPDPALLCAEMFFVALEKNGIKCNRDSVVSNYKKEAYSSTSKVLYTHYSPTLDKLVYYTNLKSNNQYCESLLQTLGKGNSKTGIETIKEFCDQRGLNVDELYMTDGCGLARANTTTPAFLTQFLVKIATDSAVYKALRNSLPVAGYSGSMSSLGKGKWIEGNMQAKTGYINRARAYCGYVKCRSGRELAFAVMMNNYTCSAKEAKLKLEKFLVTLGEF